MKRLEKWINRRIERESKRVYQFLFSHIDYRLVPSIGRSLLHDQDMEYIVSLTSWEPRFDVLPIALKSILLQTRKPDRIILYLGDDVNPENIPDSIRQFENKGVDIRFVNENLRAHKKYYYAMEEYPNSTIITVDDDVIYSPFTISSLINTSKRFKDCVCARRTHRMTFADGKILPYDDWPFEVTDSEARFDLLGTGVGGILYPPHSLHKDLFDKKALKEIAFSNDDLWLKGMELLHGTKTKTVKCLWRHPIPILSEDKYSLFNTNVLNNENDRILGRLQERYPGIMSKCIQNGFERDYRNLVKCSMPRQR